MQEEYEDGEQNVYSEDTREEWVESDEISAEEEAFMKGYDEADEEEKHAKKKKKAEEEDEDEDFSLEGED